MERNKKIEHEIVKSLKDYSAAIIWENQSYKLTAYNDAKSIIITWPYPLMEVYFDFSENDITIMSESIEFYENETEKDFCDYIIYIIKRFFSLPTRVEIIGRFPKRKELQVNKNNEWCSIYE